MLVFISFSWIRHLPEPFQMSLFPGKSAAESSGVATLESPSLGKVTVGQTHLLLFPHLLLREKNYLLEAEGGAGGPGRLSWSLSWEHQGQQNPRGRSLWPVSLRAISWYPVGPREPRAWEGVWSVDSGNHLTGVKSQLSTYHSRLHDMG